MHIRPGVHQDRGADNSLIVLGWIGLLTPYALHLIGILRANHTWLLLRTRDDSFYYFEIATRISRGEGMTFDGIHETNGFHPLWQFVLVPLARVFHGDALVQAAMVLGVLTTLAAVLLVVRVVWRIGGPGPALVGGIVASQSTLLGATTGMEGPVVLLALALLLTALARAGRASDRRRYVFVGLACALLVLARLDYVLVLPVVGAAIAWRERRWRPVGWWVAGGAAVGVPFAIAWYVRWGHVLTTSSEVKNFWTTEIIDRKYGGRFNLEYGNHLLTAAGSYVDEIAPWHYPRIDVFGYGPARVLGFFASLGLLALASVGAIAVWRGRIRTRSQPLGPDAWAIVTTLLMLAAKALLDLTLNEFWATTWYSVGQQLGFGFAVGAVAWLGARELFGRMPAAGVLAALILVLVAVPTTARTTAQAASIQRSATWHDQSDYAADWVIEQGPEGRYGARDAGVLGFRLDGERELVNLDGLANDYSFVQLVIRGGDIRELIQAAEVDVFVGRVRGDELDNELACGTVLWTSPSSDFPAYLPFVDATTSESEYIIDVRGCRSPEVST